MKRAIEILVVAGTIILSFGFGSHSDRHSNLPTAEQTLQDTQVVQFNQDQEVKDLRDRIAGQEDKPASEVFKNIQMLKTTKAGQLPDIMVAWTKALGKDCMHCHAIEGYDKETKPQKQIARDMITMVGDINTKTLPKIKNLDSKEPRISCWTCHRGQLKPERRPPESKK
jgi:hypothetical protein